MQHADVVLASESSLSTDAVQEMPVCVERVLCAFKERAGFVSLGHALTKGSACFLSVADIGFFVEDEVRECLGIVDEVKIAEALEFGAADIGLLAFVSVESAKGGEWALLAELQKGMDGAADFGEWVSVENFLSVDAKACCKA